MLKKILLFLLVVLLLIIAACITLYVIGGKTYTYSTSTTIAATPEQIWPWLSEPDRVKQWLTGLVENTPTTDGGPRLGARAAITLEDNNNRFTMSSEITRFEPPRTIEFRIEMTGAMAGTGHTIGNYNLAPEAASTLLTYTVTSKSEGWMRCFAPLMSSSVQQRIESDVASLKRTVESQPTPPPPSPSN